MKFIRTEIRVRRYHLKKTDPELGPPYVIWQRDEQWLIKVWLVTVFPGWQFRIWTRVLDKEIIPEYIVISHACFGESYGWKSKFHDYIGNQNDKSI